MQDKRMYKTEIDKICHSAINSKKWLRLSRRLEREFKASGERQLQKQRTELAASCDHQPKKSDLKCDAAKEPPAVASTNALVCNKAPLPQPSMTTKVASLDGPSSSTCSFLGDAKASNRTESDSSQESSQP